MADVLISRDARNSLPMRDIDIRRELDRRIRARPAQMRDAVVRHEVGIVEGERRIDLAVFNGHFTGYEIKSDVDTLSRLPAQAEAYGRVMDYLTIVTTEKYVSPALDILPDFWGVDLADRSPDGRVTIRHLRRPRINRSTDAMATAMLLWRSEAMEILQDLGEARGLSNKSRWCVWERLVRVIPKRTLRRTVLRVLKYRADWTGGQLQPANDDLSPTNANY